MPLLEGKARDGQEYSHPSPAGRHGIALRLALFSWGCYLCMYGMRKPWAALEYIGEPLLLGMHPKVAIALAQVIGYFFGKLAGISIVPCISSRNLSVTLLGFGCGCTLGWLGFYMLPRGILSLLAIALGAFPGAMVWSLIYRYIEGRRCSDAVGGVYGTSMIIGPGVSKLAGSLLATVCDRAQISEWAVPFIANLCVFLPGYCLCVHGLRQVPPPTPSEISEMGDRSAIVGGISAAGGASFASLLWLHWPGILAVGVFNACMLGVREVRDTFQPEIWESLYQHVPAPATFLLTEVPATVVVLLVCQRVSAVRSPHTALLVVHALLLVCALSLPLLGVLRGAGLISGATWFMSVGSALSLGSVLVSSCFFDRVIAAMRFSGSAGVLIQTADMLGYIGTLSALLVVEKEEDSTPSYVGVGIARTPSGVADGWQAMAGGSAPRAAVVGNAPALHSHPVMRALHSAAVHMLKQDHPYGGAALSGPHGGAALSGPHGDATRALPGSGPYPMVQMVESFFYVLGPLAALCALASMTYWSRAIKADQGRRRTSREEVGSEH